MLRAGIVENWEKERVKLERIIDEKDKTSRKYQENLDQLTEDSYALKEK